MDAQPAARDNTEELVESDLTAVIALLGATCSEAAIVDAKDKSVKELAIPGVKGNVEKHAAGVWPHDLPQATGTLSVGWVLKYRFLPGDPEVSKDAAPLATALLPDRRSLARLARVEFLRSRRGFLCPSLRQSDRLTRGAMMTRSRRAKTRR